MADPVVHLLRHGETEVGACYCGRQDVALSAKGWQQMRAATKGVGQWQAIISSPLRRCRDFAEWLASVRGLPLALDERLAEMDFGAWEGRSSAELMATEPDALARFWRDPLAYPPPGGESLTCLQRRVLTAWNDIRSRRAPLLVVCHGGPMRVLLGHASGLPLGRVLELGIPHAALVSLSVSTRAAPTSVTP